MKVRYCDTILKQWKPCEVGWGSLNDSGLKSCTDEPIEKNCRLIVNSEDPLICPTCGTVLGLIGE